MWTVRSVHSSVVCTVFLCFLWVPKLGGSTQHVASNGTCARSWVACGPYIPCIFWVCHTRFCVFLSTLHSPHTCQTIKHLSIFQTHRFIKMKGLFALAFALSLWIVADGKSSIEWRRERVVTLPSLTKFGVRKMKWKNASEKIPTARVSVDTQEAVAQHAVSLFYPTVFFSFQFWILHSLLFAYSPHRDDRGSMGREIPIFLWGVLSCFQRTCSNERCRRSYGFSTFAGMRRR